MEGQQEAWSGENLTLLHLAQERRQERQRLMMLLRPEPVEHCVREPKVHHVENFTSLRTACKQSANDMASISTDAEDVTCSACRTALAPPVAAQGRTNVTTAREGTSS